MIEVVSLSPSLSAALRGTGADFTPLDLDPEVPETWPTEATKARVLVTSNHAPCTAALMARLPALRLVAAFGAGTDQIDHAAAKARGIVVTNTPAVTADDVADVALALILGLLRETMAADRWVRSGRWVREGAMPLATPLKGKRVGLLGFGSIGHAVALRAAACGMEPGYFARSPRPVAWQRLPGPLALATWSDVLVVALPSTGATRGMVDAAMLAALGPQGWLVNVARGDVVDEAALVAAIEAGTIAGAGLDVFADEPQVPEALIASDRCVLFPHIGSATTDTRRAMVELVRDNVAAFLATGAPLTPVR